jgi:hypothetical protein
MQIRIGRLEKNLVKYKIGQVNLDEFSKADERVLSFLWLMLYKEIDFILKIPSFFILRLLLDLIMSERLISFLRLYTSEILSPKT